MADPTARPPSTNIDASGHENPEVPPYEPSAAERTSVSVVEARYERWQRQRRPHEQQWFINAAFYRGQQYVEWNTILQAPVTSPAPSHRIRLTINKVFPKIRARQAKFLKNRPRPIVRPFTNDIEAREDARLTEKALDYAWRKHKIGLTYHDCLMQASMTGHGYLWLSWDPTLLGKVQTEDPLTHQKQIDEVALGDISIEVDGPYSLLIAEPGINRLGKQPQIMRIKIRSLDYIRSRFPDKGKFVKAETTDATGLRYQRQLALLNPTGTGGVGSVEDKTGRDESPHTAIVKELFTAPTPDYPKGRYQVVSNSILLKEQDELPYGFADFRHNPYPVVDFPDLAQAGQYWNTTVLEQLITPQREYNLIRSKVAESIRFQAFPKLLVAVQHRVPPSAWTTAPGEVVPYVAQPNIPEPRLLLPGNIVQDAWRTLELLDKEIQDITHIYPEAEGRVGEATSGFQTNLLQEAADSIHEPDIRQHEEAIEEAALKIRRLMKQGYTIPRLLSVAGRDEQPEVFEFSSEDIDENAEIVVEAGSGLPSLKAARIQSILELFNAGLFGNPQDPAVTRKVLSMLEMSTIEDAFQDARQDEEGARLENKDFGEGKQVPPPEFFQDHTIHYKAHTSQLKSAETRGWDPQLRQQLIGHVILHVKFQNPQSAILIAEQYGMLPLVQDLLQQQAAQVPQGAPPPQGAPQGPGQPQPQAPNPQQAASGAHQFEPGAGGPQGLNSVQQT